MLVYPKIDPVIFHIYGNLAIRWYSLAYIFGFILSYVFLRKQNRVLGVVKDELCEKFITYIVVGVILGARVFYCFFYNFSETIRNPLIILKTWEGGMSFHGGVIGIFIGCLIFTWKYKVNAFKIVDLCVVVVPIALFFGRIANFINGELYGNITYTSPFRMIFPADIAQQPRHPSQLYEAFAEGICLFAIMFLIFKKTKAINKTGILCCCFAMFYSIARFICEFFRRPDMDLFFGLTAGQFLSLIMATSSAISLIFLWRRNVKNVKDGKKSSKQGV